MAEIKLTAAQQAVVDDRGGPLLVAAAAGSGKTKVLVDRLMAQVCDPAQEIHINEFLIITYTNAAAAELRAKIASELSRRLAQEPENRHLQRQVTRIYLTPISTVHAYCAGILREYAHVLDIPADFRVAEEKQSAALRQEVFDDLLDECYVNLEREPELRALIDQIGYGRDDRRLFGLVMSVYQTAMCRVSPKQWLCECADAYTFGADTPAEQTPWGRYLIEAMRESAATACDRMEEALRVMAIDDVLQEKYAPTFEEELRQLRGLLSLETWDEVFAANVQFGRLKPVRNPEDPSAKEAAQRLRDEAKAVVKGTRAIFYGDSKRVMDDLARTSGAIRGLVELIRRFEEAYGREKKRRKLMDFSDLEHAAIRLLVEKGTGRSTAAARELSRRYREILVDEYQDSNAVQECIFSALSREGQNRFMVGDVKQSIYRFRMADPSIFLDKYEKYPLYTQERPGEGRKILLSENFRSRREVLWAANDVFSLIMHRQAGELDYTEAEALKPGRVYPDTPQKKIELHCIQMEDQTDDDLRQMDKATEEASFVANRIARLLREKTPVADGEETRPIRPGDIVILMRSPESAAGAYMAALAEHRIPCVSDRGGNLLLTAEAQVFRAILQIVDNPHRDIPLTAAMASPVFAFSQEELASVRAAKKKGDLYDCLCGAERKSEKLTGFLNWLSGTRERAVSLTLPELLDYIQDSTGLVEVYSAMTGGVARRANLSAFRQLAVDNASAFGGSLMGFCDWLEELLDSGTSMAPPQTENGEDAVRIMSIHKSKGLEFPVVVLADLSRKFNFRDNAQPVLLDEELLIGSNVVDTEDRCFYSSIARTAIAARKKRKTLAEEMRVLYVAMTRAKEMLIMTYCSARVAASLSRLAAAVTVPLHPETALSAACMGDWVLMTALCRTEAGELFAYSGPCEASSVHEDTWHIAFHTVHEAQGRSHEDAQESTQAQNRGPEVQAMEEALAFVYPHAEATRLPSKLTATQLKGRTIDEEAAQEAPAPRMGRVQFRRPSFRRDAPLTPRERGNATHLFMQYVRYEACATLEGIEAERQRLVREQYLTAQQAEAVDAGKILHLFESSFGQRILAARDAVREFKFSILTDAAAYVPQAAGEQIMLQGVVDCFWREAEGLVIVDFKTDRIRGNLAQKTADYTPQLRAYAEALGRIYGCPVKACYLYFFDVEREIPI